MTISTPLFTYSILSVVIPAGAIGVILAYSFILFITGDRVGAKNYMFMSIQIALTILAIGGAYLLGNLIIKEISGQSFSIEDAWGSLNLAGDKFEEIYRKAVDWIVYLGVTRATWGLIPYIGVAISESLGAATLWQNWVFSIASTTFLGLEWFARILIYLHPWLLTFGAGLAATPRFKTVGGILLSIYLVSGASMVIIADYSYNIVFNLYGEDVNKAPSASNPLVAAFTGATSIITLAGDADRASQGFMWAAVLAMIGTLIMGVLTAGVSRIFEGIPAIFRPI